MSRAGARGKRQPGFPVAPVDDGRLEIDNNAAERALRAVALGRKNYLFAGSNTGGERTTALCVVSCTTVRYCSW
jgi:hypothetical protein